MKTLAQSPHDPAFIQDPYTVYDAARARGPVLYWEDYGMPAAFDAATVTALLRDRRLGRQHPDPAPTPAHLQTWARLHDNSMLELEPPRHTRLRGQVLRAFTSRRIANLGPDIDQITQDLLADLPDDRPFDLIPQFCTQLPVRIIARLLGVPEDKAPDLLRWSTAMVAMYMAGATRATEDAAEGAAREFVDYLSGYIDQRRARPGDDLISHLIGVETQGDSLDTDELISTCILLLNAGHEATVHTLGNAVKCLLENATDPLALAPHNIAATVEEVLRYDPPLHIFTRHAYDDIDLGQTTLKKGAEIALVLGAAGRDPEVHVAPDLFNPQRPGRPHAAFGGGLHFCVGAPLARLELQRALPALFAHLPDMSLTETPRYADSYHFHKLERLMITP
ncbi:Biotin biosynthesis cytochrome P450 [Sulfitobacter sp. THAF37]|uniref:cytochrome P450 n=1 Tax=Sulfitobacter sp. THAF37 TaxID=2587855 RepID=UPI0012691F1D|nr:cytochrome P450 [Sulfitobacter sp. THAF37]QFT60191.1 Biotin biosynthesis cytochrome P450 [Sulfitobacter sp. THAF37]